MKKLPASAGHAAQSLLQQVTLTAVSEAAHQPVHVEPMLCEHTADPSVRLRMGAPAQGELVLSIAQARALSLALIAAVNKQEQYTHARHKQARLSAAPQPAER